VVIIDRRIGECFEIENNLFLIVLGMNENQVRIGIYGMDNNSLDEEDAFQEQEDEFEYAKNLKLKKPFH